MSAEELALETARIALEKARVEMYKDFAKVGIPSLITIISIIISARLHYLLKKFELNTSDKERRLKVYLSKLEANNSSLESLLERKREHVENASINYEVFASSTAIYYTQVIVRLIKLEKSEEITSQFEETMKNCEEASWNSYYEANKAKRILELIGCNDASEKIISLMTHVSKTRRKYQSFIKGEYKATSKEINREFQEFRRLGKDFTSSLNKYYDTLAIDNK